MKYVLFFLLSLMLSVQAAGNNGRYSCATDSFPKPAHKLSARYKVRIKLIDTRKPVRGLLLATNDSSVTVLHWVEGKSRVEEIPVSKIRTIAARPRSQGVYWALLGGAVGIGVGVYYASRPSDCTDLATCLLEPLGRAFAISSFMMIGLIAGAILGMSVHRYKCRVNGRIDHYQRWRIRLKKNLFTKP